ncbi:MAG TPA: cytochrome P450 [Thermomicrobiaceae bacterium]|nr:cytochrome P450 [Thermomicrobiaceae bacterium]
MPQPDRPSLPEINLADPDQFLAGHPHAAWRRLRAEAPVSWNEGTEWFPGFWSITRYDDVFAISRDTATFSSERGFNLTQDPENQTPVSGVGKILLGIDPPRHRRLRRLITVAFTPRRIARLEPGIRAITTGILDAMAPRGACDFVVDVAAKLPLAAICQMTGVPDEDWDRMFTLTNQVLGAGDPEYQTTPGDPVATAARGYQEMFGYFARLLAARRAQPRDDLVSALAAAQIDGQHLSDEEILYFCYLLILAGNETTRNATSGGLLALIEHPAELARLRADPSLMPSAVEEVLRWTSPVLHMARSAKRDVELRGVSIAAGERVVLWYPSANRDEEVFPESERFDVGRTPNYHLAFGIGEHVCLGLNLARLELRVMFEELLRRLPDLALAGDVERLRSTFIGGIKHMPIRFTPAA